MERKKSNTIYLCTTAFPSTELNLLKLEIEKCSASVLPAASNHDRQHPHNDDVQITSGSSGRRSAESPNFKNELKYVVETDLTSRCTVLVVGCAGTAKHETARRRGIPCVTKEWVTVGHCDPSSVRLFPVPALLGLQVSTTSLSPAAIDHVKCVAERHGGRYSSHLNRQCALLVVPTRGVNLANQKVMYARKHSQHIRVILLDQLLLLASERINPSGRNVLSQVGKVSSSSFTSDDESPLGSSHDSMVVAHSDGPRLSLPIRCSKDSMSHYTTASDEESDRRSPPSALITRIRESGDSAGHPLPGAVTALSECVLYLLPVDAITARIKGLVQCAGARRTPTLTPATTHVVLLGPIYGYIPELNPTSEATTYAIVTLEWLEQSLLAQEPLAAAPFRARVPFQPVVTLGSIICKVRRDHLRSIISRLGGIVQNTLIIGRCQTEFRQSSLLVVPDEAMDSSDKVKALKERYRATGRIECHLVPPTFLEQCGLQGRWLDPAQYDAEYLLPVGCHSKRNSAAMITATFTDTASVTCAATFAVGALPHNQMRIAPPTPPLFDQKNYLSRQSETSAIHTLTGVSAMTSMITEERKRSRSHNSGVSTTVGEEKGEVFLSGVSNSAGAVALSSSPLVFIPESHRASHQSIDDERHHPPGDHVGTALTGGSDGSYQDAEVSRQHKAQIFLHDHRSDSGSKKNSSIDGDDAEVPAATSSLDLNQDDINDACGMDSSVQRINFTPTENDGHQEKEGGDARQAAGAGSVTCGSALSRVSHGSDGAIDFDDLLSECEQRANLMQDFFTPILNRTSTPTKTSAGKKSLEDGDQKCREQVYLKQEPELPLLRAPHRNQLDESSGLHPRQLDCVTGNVSRPERNHPAPQRWEPHESQLVVYDHGCLGDLMSSGDQHNNLTTAPDYAAGNNIFYYGSQQNHLKITQNNGSGGFSATQMNSISAGRNSLHNFFPSQAMVTQQRKTKQQQKQHTTASTQQQMDAMKPVSSAVEAQAPTSASTSAGVRKDLFDKNFKNVRVSTAKTFYIAKAVVKSWPQCQDIIELINNNGDAPLKIDDGGDENNRGKHTELTGARVATQGVEAVYQCTHFVTWKVNNSETFLSALAAGMWVVHPSFLAACVRARRWLPEDDYEWGAANYARWMSAGETVDEDMLRYSHAQKNLSHLAKFAAACRFQRLNGPSCRPFRDWRVLLYCTAVDRHNSLRNVLKAGGCVSITIRSSVNEVGDEGSSETSIPYDINIVLVHDLSEPDMAQVRAQLSVLTTSTRSKLRGNDSQLPLVVPTTHIGTVLCEESRM